MIKLPPDMAMVREFIHDTSWLTFILVDRIESTILLLASQASQLYYLPYPSVKQNMKD